jgi:thioredoxin-related protein
MSTHPHFDDKGAVRWHSDYAAAAAEAKAAGKRLFIESGRQACGNCRILVEQIIPRPEVAAALNRDFVCYADDCDDMAPEVRTLGGTHMPFARSLPFVLLADADGKWLGGGSGATTAEALLKLLADATKG